jgi:prephenate dehydratase/prephenate dehydrogenase
MDLALSRPERLVVIGAAAGIGRWLGDHVLGSLPWSAVALVDANAAVTSTPHRYEHASAVDRATSIADVGEAIAAASVVVLAVPLAMLPSVAADVLPRLTHDAVVIDCSHDRTRADEVLRSVRDDANVVGLHALFGVQAPRADGQTFVVCPAPDRPDAHTWLRLAIEDAGGTVNEMTAARHDEIMRVVQTATHQSLLTFADVVGHSGLELEDDLWANRTPVFELLLALSARVLAPAQDATTASIQAADAAGVARSSMREASLRLGSVLDSDDPEEVLGHLQGLRDRFSGGLFSKIQEAGSLATSAVQSTRARVAEHRRTNAIIGVRTIGGRDRLHVGRVVHVTPTSFVLDDLLVGSAGKGALLLDETTIANARRLGIGGRSKAVEFRLGRVALLDPVELDDELDAWLATVERGVKVLIPEAIAGASAVRTAESVPGVRHAELVSEEVRLGQRECVLRLHARIDRDLQALERSVQERVDDVFQWPAGATHPLSDPDVGSIGYLGPAGTFSDVAARQLAGLLGVGVGAAHEAARVEFPDFVSVVRALEQGHVTLAVVPVTNSSSGLVDLAAEVLLGADAAVEANGVVDVPIRFDAYGTPGVVLRAGMRVRSHPQGIRQCSQFIAANELVAEECTSTAEACRAVAEDGDGVALAAAGVGEEFGLPVMRSSVGNLAGAITRFLVLARRGTFQPPARADVLQRTVWILDVGAVLPTDATPRFDEVLRGPSGRAIVVSTHRALLDGVDGARRLGTLPWSPRTPIVIV